MARLFNYLVLQATPDAMRGEKVNVGIVVIKGHELDIQIHETRKILALTGRSWDSFIESFVDTLKRADDPTLGDTERLARLKLVQGQLFASRRGWFEADSDAAYLEVMQSIVGNLVLRPPTRRMRDDSTVVAEISAALRSANVLASRDESLGTGKVVRGYPVEPGLEADFAQLNSKLHIATVLDLRSTRPQIAQAALKAVVLDRAVAVNSKYNVHKIGVYAVAPARSLEVSENIAILRRYSDDLLNWEDRHDKEALRRIFFDAFNAHNSTPLEAH